jgi:hypothetical protein
MCSTKPKACQAPLKILIGQIVKESTRSALALSTHAFIG